MSIQNLTGSQRSNHRPAPSSVHSFPAPEAKTWVKRVQKHEDGALRGTRGLGCCSTLQAGMKPESIPSALAASNHHIHVPAFMLASSYTRKASRQRAPRRIQIWFLILVTFKMQIFTSQLVPPASGPQHTTHWFPRNVWTCLKKPQNNQVRCCQLCLSQQHKSRPRKPACGLQLNQGSFFPLKCFILFVSQLARFVLYVFLFSSRVGTANLSITLPTVWCKYRSKYLFFQTRTGQTTFSVLRQARHEVRAF